MKMKIIKKLILGVFICFVICSFSFAKDFDGVFGMFRLELHEKAGTFTLSMLDSNGEIPAVALYGLGVLPLQDYKEAMTILDNAFAAVLAAKTLFASAN